MKIRDKSKILNQDGEYTIGRESRWNEGNRVILDLLREGKDVRVLDIGCGEGAGYTFLVKEINDKHLDLSKLEYHALDNNPKIIDYFKNTPVIFHLNDINEIVRIFNKHTFDFIIASEIIEHMVDTDTFILTLKDLLKKDGYIYLTTPNLASWHGRLMLLFGFQPLATEVSTIRSEFGKANILPYYYNVKAIMHVRVFTLPALKDFLHYHGFKILSIWGGGYRIDNLLFHRFLIGLSPILKVLIRKNED